MSLIYVLRNMGDYGRPRINYVNFFDQKEMLIDALYDAVAVDNVEAAFRLCLRVGFCAKTFAVIAAQNGAIKVLSAIVQKCKLDITFDDTVLLIMAVYGGHARLVDWLLDHGADCKIYNTQNNLGLLSLDPKYLDLFISKGVNPHRVHRDRSLVEEAARCKLYEHVKTLLKYNVDIHRDHDYVFQVAEYPIQKLLVDYDPDYNWKEVPDFELFLKHKFL